jgi:hypothetical protein
MTSTTLETLPRHPWDSPGALVICIPGVFPCQGNTPEKGATPKPKEDSGPTARFGSAL